MQAITQPSHPRTILVIGLAWVGDMVMSHSLFQTLRENDPSVIIDVLAPAWTLPLLSRMPEVRQGILMPIGHGKLGLKKRYHLGKILALNHYDEAIVLPNSWKSALIPFFAKIPKRTGWRGEMRWGLLNDMRVLDRKKLPLLVDHCAQLGCDKHSISTRPTPFPKLLVKEQILEATLQKLSLKRPTEHPLLILCPGTEGGIAKRWPERYFSALANTKIQEGWQVWLMGSPKDIEIANRVQTGIQEQYREQCINLSGKTTLEEAIDLLSLASQVVANDSGLMHISAALNVPVIGVFGPTDPGHSPPLSTKGRAVELPLSCRPCFKSTCPLKHHQCMQNLKPELVAEAFIS